jgi:hypothetical protein
VALNKFKYWVLTKSSRKFKLAHLLLNTFSKVAVKLLNLPRLLFIVMDFNTSYSCRAGEKKRERDTSEKMDEAWAQQNKDEEQPIMWLNKLPPGVKIPLTAEQMAKVAKMVKLTEIYSTYKHLPVTL